MGVDGGAGQEAPRPRGGPHRIRSTTRQPGLGSGQLLRIKVDGGSEYGTDGTDSGKVPYRRKIPGAPQEPPDGIEGTYGTGGTELARGAQFRTFDEL